MGLLNLLFGVGIFLLGMKFLEEGLGEASQNKVRLYLSRYTRHPVSAAFTGTVITALLQSSSVVTLIMMAMVGAGVVPLINAIGVVIGANLGTTFTGWLVTVLGFKLNLTAYAIPLLGTGAIVKIFFSEFRIVRATGSALMGLGLLLFGLSLMKTAVANLPELIDFTQLQGLPAWAYLLAGAFLTAIIQSSSATMMITLTLLNAGLIDLQDAAAFIIGADLGTTSTAALGAIKGQATRKRLALAHIIFNTVVDITAFIILLPLLPTLAGYFPTQDPLLQLVLFHSSFNLLGLILFLPFLKQFADYLNGLFISKKTINTQFIHEVPITESELAIIAVTKEVKELWKKSLRYCRLGIEGRSHRAQYLQLKATEGEVIKYATQLDNQNIEPILGVTRNCVLAAKVMRDARLDWQYINQVETANLLSNWQELHKKILATIRHCIALHDKDALDSRKWPTLLDEDKQWQQQQYQQLFKLAENDRIDETALSSLLNLNRGLVSCHEKLITASIELSQLQTDNKTRQPRAT